MKISHVRTLLLASLLLAPAAASAQPGRGERPSLPAFGSEEELARFVRELAEERDRRRPPPAPTTCAAPAAPTVSHAADSGSAVIRGRVLGPSGQPVSGATVRADPAGVHGVTGTDGGYRLILPTAGPGVTVTATQIGMMPQRHVLTLSPGDSAAADFRLCHSALNLESIVVTASGVSSRASESVTNVQHAGVDEGGIVKVHGNYLVMLRRGRLFTVDVGHGRLRPVSMVDAFGPEVEDADGTWYDELLVSGDQVVVIGYSYERGGTEIGLFRIGGDGRLSYRATYHLRSNDYYSSRNYASRLVDGKLVLYTPLYFPLRTEDVSERLPALRRYRRGAKPEDFRPIAPPTRIYRPGRAPEANDLTLHTVTTCDLRRAEMTCEATGVLGSAGRVFYVSPSGVYVWVNDERPGGVVRPGSIVYRFPLDGSAPGAVGAHGSPVDQFSFLESGDGHLNVLVRSDGSGDGMWSAERSAGDVALLRVSLQLFGDGRRAAPAAAYRPLPAPKRGYAFHNRFVGRHLLYGGGSGWMDPAIPDGVALFAVPVAGGEVTRLPLPHGVDRIEVMGPDAVVIGGDGEDLHFTAVSLSGRPRVAHTFARPDASQGELRSHGFFYKPDGTGSGVIGLPIREAGHPGYSHLFDESASVLFVRNDGARFHGLGELESRPEGSDDDGCVASCVDWYGNARPLFLRGRIFALLGYELVEGAMRGRRIRELRRVSFAPDGGEMARQ